MTVMASRSLKDWSLLAALVVLWGSNFMFIKLGVAAVPPATLVAARLVIGALILVAVVRFMGYAFPPLGRALWGLPSSRRSDVRGRTTQVCA